MKKKFRFSTLIEIAFVLIFIFSAVNIVVILLRYKKADDTYENLQNQYVTAATDKSTDNGSKIETAPIKVNFNLLKSQCSDINGWLYSADTVINYPVVQGDDNQYYLHKDLNGDYLVSGTLFADCICLEAYVDDNFLIYGHHMKNGSMFASLEKYKDQSYYDKHPVMYYLTPEVDYKIELFSGFVTNPDSFVYQINFGSDEDFSEFIKESKKNSTFESKIAVTSDDHLITLSTCSYDFDDARYVVIGKLTQLNKIETE